MATINTVRGAVDTADLGFTLSHEHVITNAAGLARTYPEFIDRQGCIEDGVSQLTEAHQGGVRSMIDMTTFDLGRDIAMLEEVSRRSGVQIVLTTGTHRYMPRGFRVASPDALADLFAREVEEGIEGTGIKAAVIKSASDMGGITPEEEIGLRAVCRAHNRTGAPIQTHTWSPERVGDQQVAIMEREGVDLTLVCIGHSNDDLDMEYRLGLLNKGVWLGLDRFPGFNISGTPDWEGRAQLVKNLIDAGFGDKIMLGHDYSVPRGQVTEELREQRTALNPDGYLFITRRVLPRLKELGVSNSDIDKVMVQNPRRFLEGR